MAAGIFALSIMMSIGSSLWFIIAVIIAFIIGRVIWLRDNHK